MGFLVVFGLRVVIRWVVGRFCLASLSFFGLSLIFLLLASRPLASLPHASSQLASYSLPPPRSPPRHFFDPFSPWPPPTFIPTGVLDLFCGASLSVNGRFLVCSFSFCFFCCFVCLPLRSFALCFFSQQQWGR